MNLRRSSRTTKALVSYQDDGRQPVVENKKRRRNKSETVQFESKSHPDATAAPEKFRKPRVPRTPKRQRTTAAPASPITPTPSIVGVMTAPYSTGDIDDATPPPPLHRPVEPNRTTATLVTPGGSKAVAYPVNKDGNTDQSPSKTAEGLPPPIATAGDLLDKACQHLIGVDPRMEPLIAKHHCRVFSPEGLAEKIDPFRSLVSGIVAQQVSGAAAKAIKNRFIALFNDSDGEGASIAFPKPSDVAKADITRLRQAGLSQRKAEYIQGLAEKFASGELSTGMLLKASDEEIMEKLIAVRGLGKWSIEMFLLFAMKRMNIWSNGDLGVQRGLAAFVGKDVAKLKAKGGKWKYMSEEEMVKISDKYEPYRGLFMWYMWRVEDVDVDAVQNAQ
ncbi:MAG: hypothetical protein Q9160_007481 [Pyrenula sp. 1 TL-2023]